MIEKMKKLSLIVHHDSRVELVNGLQDLGVYHIEQKTPISGERIAYLREHIAFLTKYLNLLSQYQSDFKVNLPQDNWKDSIAELAREIDAFKSGMDEVTVRSDLLRKEAGLLSNYGEFDPAMVEGLEKNKVRVAFCSTAKSKFDKLDISTLALSVLSESRGGISYVVFVKKGERLTEKEQEVLANQEVVPMKRLSAVRAEIAKCAKEFDAKQKAIIDRTKYIDCIKNHLLLDQDMLANELAQTSMVAEAEGSVYVLTGFVPEANLPSVETFLASLEVVHLVEEPTHHDAVPVKLKMNPFARLFEPILRMFSIPNYWELDTTPFFAPFYAIFFGLCVADFGYGALLFVVALIGLVAIKNKGTRKLLLLGLVLATSTMLAGVLLDDYFGVRPATEYAHELAKVASDGGAEAGNMDTGENIWGKFLMSVSIFREQKDAMLLPMLLGVLQVTFGWMLRIRNQIRHHGWQGFGQPTGNILIMGGVVFFLLPGIIQSLFSMSPAELTIGPIPVGQWMTAVPGSVGQGFLIVGVLLVLLFNGLEGKTKIFLRPLTGIWSLYELVQGLIGDILSYIRLFALGLAGGLLAESFNNIALGLPVVFMLVVLLLGHAINLGIGLLSAFVHSLRLQFVEFYKAIEFKGGGIEYEPLHSSKLKASSSSVKK